MVISGVTGLLVNVKILEEIICAVSYFKNLWYNKREDYEKYSSNARRNALKYDWEIVINQIENMFTTVART
jgi:glycosyltransferase involved in cell wall biosynthesis